MFFSGFFVFLVAHSAVSSFLTWVGPKAQSNHLKGAGRNAYASRLREEPLERKCTLRQLRFFPSSKKLIMPLTDKFGRPITDLRISITDRCNYKCVYCRTG